MYANNSGVLNLLVLAYIQIKIVTLCVPHNQSCISFTYPQIKNFTQISFFWEFFKFVYPLWAYHAPLGICLPQVENNWPSSEANCYNLLIVINLSQSQSYHIKGVSTKFKLFNVNFFYFYCTCLDRTTDLLM